MTSRLRVTPSRPTQIFWTAVIVLILVSFVAVFTTNRLLAQYSASAQSLRIVQELDRLHSDLKDIETGTRGYALTRDRRFLTPYEQGNTSLKQTVSRLQILGRQEPSLASAIEDLTQASERRAGLASAVVRLVAQGASQSEVLASINNGKVAMDDIRNQVGTLVNDQRQIHQYQREGFERQAKLASLALAIGVGFSLLVLVWLFSLLNREVFRRRMAEGELRVLNVELEERVQMRSREVEEGRRLLNAIIENMPDTVFLKDVGDQFKYVMINEAGEKLLGRDRAELIGHVDHELFPRAEATLCRREDRQLVESLDRKLVSERLLTTALGRRFIETRKVPLALDGGGERYVLGIVRDLTEQRALETQVREMQRLESVGRLTGGIAHDFNNLLAVIMGSVELVREQLANESEAAAIADEALDAVRRGADLVRRLLAYARKQHLEPIAIDLNDRLPSIIPLLQRTLGEQVRLQVKSAEDLWHATIDPTQVDDALVNLAINARDAMPEGGTLTIETGNVVLDADYAAHHVEVEPGQYVMLAVSDTGVGMKPDVLERAFEPFFTTKEEGKGTGLGLSQVFGWVKQSGGHIKIYSELRHGTTIKLYLPKAMGAEPGTPEIMRQEPDAGGHETVLVVEDNPNVRRTVKRQLTDLGYATIEAGDGETALEQIRAGIEFDLLLTDIVMPGGMSGYELAAEVQKLRPGIKVLFTSGYTELAATGMRPNSSGPLISKPYSKRDLGRALRSLLDEGQTS